MKMLILGRPENWLYPRLHQGTRLRERFPEYGHELDYPVATEVLSIAMTGSGNRYLLGYHGNPGVKTRNRTTNNRILVRVATASCIE